MNSQLITNEKKIIRPGCFQSDVKNPPLDQKCMAAGRCRLAPDCMWTKDEMELRKNPLRGADTSERYRIISGG